MTEDSFNLVDEPWLLARRGSDVSEVSLQDAFASAHELTSLAGEIPTQEAAVFRILLTILRRALPQAGRTDEAQDQWLDLWQAKTLPMEAISAYLSQHRDRFDLLDRQAPFMQVADLEGSKTSGLTKLIADVPAGHPYFTTRSGTALDSLSYAEAARWVVHCQAYDPSGIKTGAYGDDRVKGGRGYPIGTGWAGRCGLVILEGATLKDTLLLNLVLAPTAHRVDDLPVWERPPLTAAIEAGHAKPAGPCDIMTWPIRRIRLISNGSEISDVLISNGDVVPWANEHDVEWMSGWRFSEPQTKKLGMTAYMPRLHDPERAFWRGIGGYLATTVNAGADKNEAVRSIPPSTVSWLAAVRSLEPSLGETPITMRAIGMSYGPQDSTVAGVIDDALRLRAAVLTDHDLNQLVRAAVETADNAVQAFANLAGTIAESRGLLPGDSRDSSRATAFATIGAGFRRWLAALQPDSDFNAAVTAWESYLFSELTRLANEVVAAAGVAAWMGRTIQDRNGREVSVSSPQADRRFRRALRIALPHAAQLPQPKADADAS